MVFQSYAVWPHRTVFENVGFSLKMKKVPKDEAIKRVRKALAVVGLSDFETRGASQLSGGQMQRVALARSLVMQPSVLLLDEPLSNLDARLRERLRIELREIQLDLNLTTVYVTHDQIEAFALADRIALMQHGRIVQIGTPQEIYAAPSHQVDRRLPRGRQHLPVHRRQERQRAHRHPDRPPGLAAGQPTCPPSTGPTSLCLRAEDLLVSKAARRATRPGPVSGGATSTSPASRAPPSATGSPWKTAPSSRPSPCRRPGTGSAPATPPPSGSRPNTAQVLKDDTASPVLTAAAAATAVAA